MVEMDSGNDRAAATILFLVDGQWEASCSMARCFSYGSQVEHARMLHHLFQANAFARDLDSTGDGNSRHLEPTLAVRNHFDRKGLNWKIGALTAKRFEYDTKLLVGSWTPLSIHEFSFHVYGGG